MQTATETERKYDVPEGFALPSLIGDTGVARAGAAETHELDATYFDTGELHLARHRRTLRRRTGGSDAGWHLKTPGDGVSRTEHRLPLGDDGDADTVPAELVAEVRAIVRAYPLRPVARLRTRRIETPLHDADGRTLALVAQDEVRAETDGVEQRWQEIEVELVDGGPTVLWAVGQRLLAAGATPAGGPSKLARALGDRLTDTGPGGADRVPGDVDAVLGYARDQRDAIVANDPAVRHGDPEAVHRMRVATRRLRSTLKTYRALWPPERTAALRDELKWLGEQLGAVRDGQVLSARLIPAVEAAGPDFAPVAARLGAHLDATVRAGRTALGAALDDARYLRLLDDLDDLAERPPPGTDGPDGRPPRARTVRRRARQALHGADTLLDEAQRAGGVQEHRDELLHEARKAYKRARYAVEVFVPAVGRPAKRLAKRLTDLQDVLGAHQDAVVARQLLRDLAGRAHAAGDDTFPYGVLYARQEQAGAAALAGLSTAVRAAGKRSVRSWLG